MKITILQFSKNCGSPTRVTRLKVAPNMAESIILKKADRYLQTANNTSPSYYVHTCL